MDDGVRDGVVGNPLACSFDPAALLCRGGRKEHCLTPLQVAAVQKLYSGPRSSNVSVYSTSGGEVPGSELSWISTYFSPDGRLGWLYSGISDYFRYMIFLPDAGTSWNPPDVDFSETYKRFGVFNSFTSAANPDLRQFQQAGSRLLFY